MALRHYFTVLSTALIVVGCSSSESQFGSTLAKNPVVIETIAAGNYLVELHKQGGLPGDSKDMHGTIDSAAEPYPLPSEVAYPFSRTFRLNIKGQTFTNNYTVMRSASDSSWQLERAWQTDSSGRVVEEWPVK